MVVGSGGEELSFQSSRIVFLRRGQGMDAAKNLAVLMCFGCLIGTGCRIDSHQQGSGKNVKIATPFGGLQVKVNDAALHGGVGLPEYPGATLVKKDKDNNAADINMSFGSFQLRVKAISYRTTDSPEKVHAFYKNALGRFGGVIQCSDNHSVGTPTRTAEGLTCDNEKDSHVDGHSDVSKKMELKVGSPQHQHIVAIEPEGDGTKFALVALDLPGHLSVGDKQEQSQ